MADFRLDEATKKALLGLMPFSQNGTIDFTPDVFKDIIFKARPVFKQRAYTAQERQEIRDIYLSDDIKDKSPAILDLVRRTVLGWENLFDLATASSLPFKADADKGADKEIWGIMPRILTDALVENVSKMSGLLPQERQGLKS